MPDRSAFGAQTNAADVRWILQMMLAILVPAVLTLYTVKQPVTQGQSSPYGYTVSLLLFLIPVARLYWWRFRHPEMPHHRRALFWASLAISLVGFLLDIVFGHAFFTFPNPEATLQIRLPAWDWSVGHFVPDFLPIEEFIFYVAGALYVLVVYVWADAMWLHDYHPDEVRALRERPAKLIEVHWKSVAGFVGLVAVGVAVRWLVTGVVTIPGYYLFIVVMGFAPTVVLLNGVQRFVNWRAFAFAYVNLVLISLVWEATLGVPYNWWNYRHEHMLGIFIHAWADLPAEAVMLWLMVAWDCVIIFEWCRIWLHLDAAESPTALVAAVHADAARPDAMT